MIVVIADDLSGATELAAVAQAHGLKTEVHVSRLHTTNSQVVCVDANTRSLTAARATDITRAIALEALATGCSWIYKKCDSVLRGHVLAETRAIQAATGQNHALLIPANPSRGRCIVHGHYLIQGQPLDVTEFAHDPLFPRQSSLVTDLLSGDRSGLTIPDCDRFETLLHLAEVIRADQLPVGGSDFFAALLQTQGLGQPEPYAGWPSYSGLTRLLVCGSASAWPKRLLQANLKGNPTASLPFDIQPFAHRLASSQAGLVGLGSTSQADSLDRLAVAVADVLAAAPVDWLLLEGGETAAHVVRNLAWQRFQVSHCYAHGLATLIPEGVQSKRLLIKPGSYAWPESIW